MRSSARTDYGGTVAGFAEITPIFSPLRTVHKAAADSPSLHGWGRGRGRGGKPGDWVLVFQLTVLCGRTSGARGAWSSASAGRLNP